MMRKLVSEICTDGAMAGIESKSESIPSDLSFTNAESAVESRIAPCHAWVAREMSESSLGEMDEICAL